MLGVLTPYVPKEEAEAQEAQVTCPGPPAISTCFLSFRLQIQACPPLSTPSQLQGMWTVPVSSPAIACLPISLSTRHTGGCVAAGIPLAWANSLGGSHLPS